VFGLDVVEVGLQKEFEYCGVQIMIFVRGVPKPGYEGLSTADIWYCGSHSQETSGQWTLLTQRKMIVSASANEVVAAADQLIRHHIDAVLAGRFDEATFAGQA